MRTIHHTTRSRGGSGGQGSDLHSLLSEKIVGQPAVMSSILPYVQMYQAGLAPEGRPVGVFLLLGPSGTGKTRTVEALAGVLHGNEKSLLKIDCGEFQMEHEVAKLIGAPPGYLGHRETQPMLTQSKLNSITSERSSLSIILLDEIEKAAPSMTRLLLGVLDKAMLRLGDNNTVNFERSIIFMTSNLGAREMVREINPDFGFQAMAGLQPRNVVRKLESIGMHAMRRKFTPEFINRIDVTVTYQPLTTESLAAILEHHLTDLQAHIDNRLLTRAFDIEVSPDARQFLLDRGTSQQYGARELKRTIHRNLVQPIASLVAQDQIVPGGTLYVELSEDGQRLEMEFDEEPVRAQPALDELAPVRSVRGGRPSSTDGPRRPLRAA
ncbi:MAG: ATP-dependent Clp protease ATP-binding subunit [Acidimicrobiia bacterium]|nr:ATP-dependent Clp protease ATP-binding subunit [Acidimicrobiia bacterium]